MDPHGIYSLYCYLLCLYLSQGTTRNNGWEENVVVEHSARLMKGSANSWIVEFYHPVLEDRVGRSGRKIRRGVGVDEFEAQKIFDDLMKLLRDETYWSPSEQQRAMNDVHLRAVGIFYDQMDDEVSEDTWDLRERYIAMPKNNDGFARVMLLGSTGAGKTTVIRQLIGTAPDEVSFPAISPSRTTTCNTEFIFAPTTYTKAIVTFISQSQTRILTEESIWEAFKKSVLGRDRKRVAKALLSHPENRFRLSYILGQYRNQNSVALCNEVSDSPYPDQNSLQNDLEYILSEIEEIALEARAACPVDVEELDEAVDLLYEDFVREETARFHDLVDYILGKIRDRFSSVQSIQEGNFHRDIKGWPVYWTYESEDKGDVIAQMRWFAGNDGRRFGQLLAPVVNGIRIEGPFKPSWWRGETLPPIVLIDGEGVGHESNITTSLSIGMTTRFQEMDVIVLVDNATQPMLDIPKIILRDVAARGQTNKMIVLYTRFDQVSGSNILDDEERRDYVLAIQDSAVEAFQDAYNLNPKMVRQLQEHLSEHSFFFPHANELKNPSIGLQEAMNNFIDSCIHIAEPTIPRGQLPIPEYDFGRLVLVISEAEKLFMDKWLGLLGIQTSRYPKQHWTRIKALANRLAYWSRVTSYKELEPASDTASLLIRRLDTFLRAPKLWTGNVSPTDEEQQFIINKIAASVSEEINKLVVLQLKDKRLNQWMGAYGYTGRGSTKQRADSIRSIFEQTLPKPKMTYDELTGEFLSTLEKMIKNSVQAVKEEMVHGEAIDRIL